MLSSRGKNFGFSLGRKHLASISLSYSVIGHFSGKNRVKFRNFVNFPAIILNRMLLIIIWYFFTARCTAKRSLGIASIVCLSVRPSVCPSVTLVDCEHIGWSSSKVISQLVSLGCSLSAHPNIRSLLQGEHPEIWAQSDTPPPVDLSGGDIRSQIAAEWL